MAFVPSARSIPTVTSRLPLPRNRAAAAVVCLVKFYRDSHDERGLDIRWEPAYSVRPRGLFARKRSANKPGEREREKEEKIEADLLFPGTKSLKSILKYCDTRFLRMVQEPEYP